ncbi:MAG: PRC-barrel domain-containing protein, partial [Armatimonadetes bacterium]|nr:PRC-barrel domain-containing protein [Armatimonadota bacterium]
MDPLVDAPMRTARHLMSQPVLDIETGREIGKTNGILIDPETRRIAALRMNPGLFQAEQFIRWQDLQSMGPDALTVPSEAVLQSRRDVEADSHYLDHLQGKAVFTDSGERLGEVTD